MSYSRWDSMKHIFKRTNVEYGDWLLAALGPLSHEESANSLAGILPGGFAKYARIFHPAFRKVNYETDTSFPDDGAWLTSVSWAEVAATTAQSSPDKLSGMASVAEKRALPLKISPSGRTGPTLLPKARWNREQRRWQSSTC